MNDKPLTKIFDLYKNNQLAYINVLAEEQNLRTLQKTDIISKHYVCLDELTKGTNFMLKVNDTKDKVCINALPNKTLSGNTDLDNYLVYINILNKDINPGDTFKFQPSPNKYDVMRSVCSRQVHPLSFNKQYARLYHKNYLAEFIELYHKLDTYDFLMAMRRCWMKNAHETKYSINIKSIFGSKRSIIKRKDTGQLLKLNCTLTHNAGMTIPTIQTIPTIPELFPYLNNTKADIEDKYHGGIYNNKVKYLIFIDYTNVIDEAQIKLDIKYAGYSYIDEIEYPYSITSDTLMFATLPLNITEKPIKNIFSIPNTVYLITDFITIKYFSHSAKNRTHINSTLRFEYLLCDDIILAPESQKYIKKVFNNSVIDYLRYKNGILKSYKKIIKTEDYNENDYLLIKRAQIAKTDDEFIEFAKQTKDRPVTKCELCNTRSMDAWRNCEICGLPKRSLCYTLLSSQIINENNGDYNYTLLKKYNILENIEKYLINDEALNLPKNNEVDNKYKNEWDIYREWLDLLDDEFKKIIKDQNEDMINALNNATKLEHVHNDIAKLDEVLVKYLQSKKGVAVMPYIRNIILNKINEADANKEAKTKAKYEKYLKDIGKPETIKQILSEEESRTEEDISEIDPNDDTIDNVDYYLIIKNYRSHNPSYDEKLRKALLHIYYYLYSENNFDQIKAYMLDITKYEPNKIRTMDKLIKEANKKETDKITENNISFIYSATIKLIALLLCYLLITTDGANIWDKVAIISIIIGALFYISRGKLHKKIPKGVMIGLNWLVPIAVIILIIIIKIKDHSNLGILIVGIVIILVYLIKLVINREEGVIEGVALLVVWICYAGLSTTKIPYLAILLVIYFIGLKISINTKYPLKYFIAVIILILGLSQLGALSDPSSSENAVNTMILLSLIAIFYTIISKKTMFVKTPFSRKFIKPILFGTMGVVAFGAFGAMGAFKSSSSYPYAIGLPLLSAPISLAFSSKMRALWDYINININITKEQDIELAQKMHCIEYLLELFRIAGPHDTKDQYVDIPEVQNILEPIEDDIINNENIMYDIKINKTDTDAICKYNNIAKLSKKFNNEMNVQVIMKKIYQSKTKAEYILFAQELIPESILTRELTIAKTLY
jgi:hypothetical protein